MQKIQLENEFLKVIVSDVSAALVAFIDKASNRDIVLGYDDLATYLSEDKYIGASVGRVANRIEKGMFSIDGETYTLDINNGPNHLHGGLHNVKHKIFHAEEVSESKVVLKTILYEKEDHYPGDVELLITYELSGQSLTQRFQATATKKTLVNLTNHSYFNLTNQKDLNHHLLTLNADYYYHVDKDGLITGEKQSVTNTVFDFRQAKMLVEALKVQDAQLLGAKGFDHFFVANTNWHAILETNQLKLMIESSYPGFQLYSANYLNNDLGKNNVTYPAQNSVCVECSFLPNGINKNDTSAILEVGNVYDEYIKYTLVNKGE